MWAMVYLNAFWDFLILSAPYLLFGLVVSGLVNELLTVERVQKWIGKDSLGSIAKSSLFGVPLPLCSCSVIPTAVTLRKKGVGNGATSSFLISTPESGIDSISLTYGMMGGPMAIIRPIAAFASGFVAGVLNWAFNDFKPEAETEEVHSCCASKAKPSFVKRVLNFSFNDLLDDIAGWLLVGIVLGALLTILLPDHIFLELSYLENRLLILLIGIPLYICASASTPIALALMLKGLSPGCALLFLLVGPATNISNIAVLQKYIGIRGVVINILSIAVVALIFSAVLDHYQYLFQWNFLAENLHSHDSGRSWPEHTMALIMLVLLIKGVFKSHIRPFLTSNR